MMNKRSEKTTRGREGEETSAGDQHAHVRACVRGDTEWSCETSILKAEWQLSNPMNVSKQPISKGDGSGVRRLKTDLDVLESKVSEFLHLPFGYCLPDFEQVGQLQSEVERGEQASNEVVGDKKEKITSVRWRSTGCCSWLWL
jgi:hypothetical protein